MTSYSQSDHILGENSLQSVCKMSQSYFLCDRKSWNFHGMNCFFLHCHPISYIMIHVCNQKIDKHSEITEYGNFQTSPYLKLKSHFRVLHFIPISLALMWYTKIRKDKNKLSIIDLTSTSQSDHILDENSLQSVVNMSQSYFLCDRKSWKFSWKKLFFLHCLPISYFIIHVCNQKINEHSEMTKS